MRRLLAFAILGIWVAVVAMHVRREYFKPLALRMVEGARTIAPGTYFYVVRMDGEPIGMASSRVDTIPDGFALMDMITLEIPALDTVHTAVVMTGAELGPALDLRNFHFDVDSEVGRFRVVGRVQEPDSAFQLEIESGGSTQRSTLERAPGTLVPSAVPLHLSAAGGLEVGRTFHTRLLDASSLSAREVEIRVTAQDTMVVPTDSVIFDQASGEWVSVTYDTLPVWRLEEIWAGVRVVSWVDEDGHLVSAESPLGFTLERAPYEIARDEWQRARSNLRLAGGYGSVIGATAIAANADLGAAGESARLAVRLLGVELAGFDLDGGRQTLRGDTLFVAREDLSVPRKVRPLPYSGGGEPGRELGPTPFIQSDDPRIVETARRIAAGSSDPTEVAYRLNDWVYRTLEKDITLSIPSAVQVLEAGQGDCNEHTVLYVALARALGLPARTAVGLVHIGGRFYYHAWPEVWLGEEWVAVDPTLGQFPADATHLRFLNGGLARQVELVRLIGRLQLDVLDR